MASIPQREINYDPIREAYITGRNRATWKELSAKFGAPESSISRCAADQSWHTLRAERLELAARECDALGVVLEAASADRAIMREAADYALVSIRAIRREVEDLEDAGLKGSTKIQCLNTANFALANLAKALHELGVVGVAKALRSGAAPDGGVPPKALMQQINVIVGGAQTALVEAKAGMAEHAPTPQAPDGTPSVEIA